MIVKSKDQQEGAFADISSDEDTFFIIDQSKFNQIKAEQIEKDFRIITFDTELPSLLTQVINNMFAKITGTSNHPYVISAHETNHVLVENNFLAKAKSQLNLLGFKVIEI